MKAFLRIDALSGVLNAASKNAPVRTMTVIMAHQHMTISTAFKNLFTAPGVPAAPCAQVHWRTPDHCAAASKDFPENRSHTHLLL